MNYSEAPNTLPELLLTALHSDDAVAGLTHNFYRYPARMSPEFVREAISQFTQAGDYILDPFMGGATSIVEALAAGRRAIGIDLNPIAHFVATAKTTPLSRGDHSLIRRWAEELDLASAQGLDLTDNEPRAKNLPTEVQVPFARLLEGTRALPFLRQRRFAQCLLLKLGQWAVDCKSTFPSQQALEEKLVSLVDEMLLGLDAFVGTCRDAGISKNKITQHRHLLLRSTVNVEHDPRLQFAVNKPSLVLTSPPYPGVHVLYHRWQVAGRRETPAPYWLIGANDGHGASHYTFGSRETLLGMQNYFRILEEAYRSVRAIIHPEALVVQLVAFSDVSSQLPAFLEAMERAGYIEAPIRVTDRTRLWRRVPRRKWYNYIRIDSPRSAAEELLLFHRPNPIRR